MILLLVIGEKSAYKKESREREREKEKRTEKQHLGAFSHLLKKNSPLFPAKTLCAAWRGTHTQIKISPNLHRAPEFHSSSSLSTLRRKKTVKSTGI
jgi:hypothetical protein